MGAIVVDDDGRLLLIRRANPPAQGTWSIPGGRVEAGESHVDAVVRELAEETGLSGVVVNEVGTITREAPSGDLYVIRDYVLKVTSVDGLRAGDDASDAAWFARDQLDELNTSPGLVDTLAGWGVLRP